MTKSTRFKEPESNIVNSICFNIKNNTFIFESYLKCIFIIIFQQNVCHFTANRRITNGNLYCISIEISGIIFKIKTIINTGLDRKSTRLNSSHVAISYAVFCLKKKNKDYERTLSEES